MNSRVMKQRVAEQQEVADRNFYFVKTLSLEMTRRCNMNCRFCSRGDAQNLDMSKEIIDKTLDEIEHFDVHGIRLNGGEPLLAKDGIIYLVDEIIRRGTKLQRVDIFTNGLVQDLEIKSALVKLGEYCKRLSNTPWSQKMQQIGKATNLKDWYNDDAYVSIIVSTTLHDNANIIDQTINFYNDGVDLEILCAVNQDKSFTAGKDTVQVKESPFDVGIVLRGNALKNFKSLYDEGFRKFMLHENEFNLMHDTTIYEHYAIFNKSISVSATGAVFPGCLQPYEDIDSGKDLICDNILNCNGNLMAYISDYSWEHPLSENQSQLLDAWKTALLYYENGIEDCWIYKKQLNKNDIEVVKANIQLMTDFEEGLRKLHRLYPTTVHHELNMVGATKYAYSVKDMEVRKYILTEICGYKIGEDGLLSDYSDEALENLLDEWDRVYYKRKYELYGDASPSDALIEQVTTDVTSNFLSGLLAGFGKQLLNRWK